MNREYRKEMDFDIDNFGEQKFLKSSHSLGTILLNLLLLRPGSFPSMPHLGLNIYSKLYNFSEEIDTDEIKNDLQVQCTELLPHLLLGDIQVFTTSLKGQDILMITIRAEVDADKEETMVYGFMQNKNGETVYQYDVFK